MTVNCNSRLLIHANTLRYWISWTQNKGTPSFMGSHYEPTLFNGNLDAPEEASSGEEGFFYQREAFDSAKLYCCLHDGRDTFPPTSLYIMVSETLLWRVGSPSNTVEGCSSGYCRGSTKIASTFFHCWELAKIYLTRLYRCTYCSSTGKINTLQHTPPAKWMSSYMSTWNSKKEVFWGGHVATECRWLLMALY